jgi:dTDP-4-dehydrorhamnose 3,5-epimerase-like enzyme
MQLSIHSKYLDGIAVIKPEVFEVERGFFTEIDCSDQFKELEGSP